MNNEVLNFDIFIEECRYESVENIRRFTENINNNITSANLISFQRAIHISIVYGNIPVFEHLKEIEPTLNYSIIDIDEREIFLSRLLRARAFLSTGTLEWFFENGVKFNLNNEYIYSLIRECVHVDQMNFFVNRGLDINTMIIGKTEYNYTCFNMMIHRLSLCHESYVPVYLETIEYLLLIGDNYKKPIMSETEEEISLLDRLKNTREDRYFLVKELIDTHESCFIKPSKQ